jgi:hypothetical protein
MKDKKKNIFGGGNANSLYTPMSETEQETVSRLIEADDLYIEIVDWGIVHQPRFTLGDARLGCYFTMHFSKPAVPQVNYYFDLELKTRSGILLFRERQPTIVLGKPIQIGAGMFLDLAWDIMIQKMDPALIKALRPNVTGLTSRLDNMKLDAQAQKTLFNMRKAEEAARKIKIHRIKQFTDT